MRELFAAIEEGKLEKIEAILKLCSELISTENENGETVLHVAAKRKRWRRMVDLFTYLIGLGAEVNAIDNSGNTCLHLIAESYPLVVRGDGLSCKIGEKAYAETASLLLKNNININVKNRAGDTALFSAIKGLAKCLSGNVSQNFSIFSSLLTTTNVNNRDKDGNTLLMLAAGFGFSSLVKILLSLKAQNNAQNNYGETALMHVVRGQFIEIEEELSALLECGADSSLVNKRGETLLHIALQRRNINDIRLARYIKARCNIDINQKRNDFDTALSIAIQRKSDEHIKWLLSEGAVCDDLIWRTAKLYYPDCMPLLGKQFLLSTPIHTVRNDPHSITPKRRIIIRIWTSSKNPDVTKLNVKQHLLDLIQTGRIGHVAIEIINDIESTYISFSPDTIKEGKLSFFRPSRGIFLSADKDIKEEGKPTISLNLYTLNVDDILSYIRRIQSQNNTYGVLHESTDNNCCTMALRILLAGDTSGILRSACKSDLLSILSPNLFATIAASAYESERKLHPELNSNEFKAVEVDYLFPDDISEDLLTPTRQV